MNGAFILESDTQDNVIATWQYPALEPELEEVILGQWKALLHKKKEAEPAGPTTVMFTSYSRFKQTWIYVSTKVFVRPLDEKGEVILDATEADDELFPKVYAIAVVIIADNFNPAKFLDFSNLLLTLYNKDGHPLNLLKWYRAITNHTLLKIFVILCCCYFRCCYCCCCY